MFRELFYASFLLVNIVNTNHIVHWAIDILPWKKTIILNSLSSSLIFPSFNFSTDSVLVYDWSLIFRFGSSWHSLYYITYTIVYLIMSMFICSCLCSSIYHTTSIIDCNWRNRVETKASRLDRHIVFKTSSIFIPVVDS